MPSLPAVKRLFVTKNLLFGMLLLGVLLATSSETLAAEIPAMPAGHPRVYVRPADLPRLKKNLTHPKLQAKWERVRTQKEPLSQAFVYLMTQDKKAGRQAIDGWFKDIRKLLGASNLHGKSRASGKKISKLGRVPQNQQHMGACVYDWCYDLFTPEERQQAVELFVRAAKSHSPGFPPKRGGSVAGHNAEGWILTGQLPVGVAIYDEFPELYNKAAVLFIEEFKPVRDFVAQAHMHHQGHAYGGARFQHNQYVNWLFRRLGKPDILSKQSQYVPYQSLYGLRPDGQPLRRGDGQDYVYNGPTLSLLAGTYYNDKVLMGTFDDHLFGNKSDSLETVSELLFRDPELENKKLSTLPLTKYFPSPMGHMVARTGWKMGIDSPNALVHMNLGEYHFGNHQHADSGTFQIYYRGALAIPAGVYHGYGTLHHTDYYGRTLSKNALLIHDPNEKFTRRNKPRANDAGQIFAADGDNPRDLQAVLNDGFKVASVTGHAFGPDPLTPQYSYLAGDITGAYSPGKAKTVTRSMVTFNTGDPKYPCVFVVFDRIETTNPDFKKTWLLHSIQEPETDDRFVTIVRDEPGYAKKNPGLYGGKLVVERLLPEEAVVTKIGGPGKEYWVESSGGNLLPTDYVTNKPFIPPASLEGGAWRVEISPKTPAKSDHFLHVMTVMDKQTSAPAPSQRIETDLVVGLRSAGFGVVFSKNGKELDTVELNLPGDQPAKLLVTDLQPGKWSVVAQGKSPSEVEVTEEGRCAFVEATPGKLTLQRVR